jgi:hypothetical protein
MLSRAFVTSLNDYLSEASSFNAGSISGTAIMIRVL